MKRYFSSNHRQNLDSQESGFVAIFSVIFFTLLSLVITIGFIRIVNVEQQQALNNDLTARALAAAEAGVEDAKRAIAYYAELPDTDPEKENFLDAFNSGDCDALFRGGSVVRSVLGLDNEGRVAAQQNLFYTCLTVDLDTANYIKTIARDESHVVPLRANGSYDRIRLEWHLNSDQSDENGDGIPDNYHPVGTLPTINGFGDQGAQPPAYLRAQLIGMPKDAFNRSDLEDRGRTVFLAPSLSGGTEIGLQTADPRGFNSNKSSPFEVDCQSSDEALANTGGYACSVTMTMPSGGLSPEDNDYYLQLTPLYRDTRVSVRLADGDEPRMFNAVQPKIDSTGKAADVFRRVEARVNFPGAQYEMPRYGVEVGDNICKRFEVTGSPDGFVNPISDLETCTGTTGTPGSETCDANSDIVLVLDTSGSMSQRWESNTALDRLEQVARVFVQNTSVGEDNNRVSIVTFDTTSELGVGLTGNQGQLISFINQLSASGQTYYINGLNEGFQELNGPRGRPDSPKVIVFISDGAPETGNDGAIPEDRGEIRARTTEMKNAGVILYTVGIDGQSFARPDEPFDEQLLIDMAGNGGDFANANSEAELQVVLSAISEDLDC